MKYNIKLKIYDIFKFIYIQDILDDNYDFLKISE